MNVWSSDPDDEGEWTPVEPAEEFGFFLVLLGLCLPWVLALDWAITHWGR